mgnify:FL=1
MKLSQLKMLFGVVLLMATCTLWTAANTDQLKAEPTVDGITSATPPVNPPSKKKTEKDKTKKKKANKNKKAKKNTKTEQAQ